MSKSLIVWVIAIALSVGLLIFSVLKVASLTNATASKPIVKEAIQSEFTSEGMTGITLITDNVTGCQYLRDAYRGGITPRMYSDGIQVCGQSTYPNGEHEHE